MCCNQFVPPPSRGILAAQLHSLLLLPKGNRDLLYAGPRGTLPRDATCLPACQPASSVPPRSLQTRFCCFCCSQSASQSVSPELRASRGKGRARSRRGGGQRNDHRTGQTPAGPFLRIHRNLKGKGYTRVITTVLERTKRNVSGFLLQQCPRRLGRRPQQAGTSCKYSIPCVLPSTMRTLGLSRQVQFSRIETQKLTTECATCALVQSSTARQEM